MLKNLACFIGLLLLLSSCYENIEGCLDVNATNFNVEADRPCEDCCTFPNLRLSVQHLFNEPTLDTTFFFRYDSVYSLNGVDSFQITNIRYYLSEFELIDVNGNTFGVEEQLRLFFPDVRDTTILDIEDNFALVDRAIGATRTLGSSQRNGAFTGIQFKVGLNEDVRAADPAFFADNHPLALGDSLLYDFAFDEYVVTQIDLARDATAATTDTIRLNILASDYFEPVTVNLDFNIDVGFNSIIALQVDYRKWLTNIDVKNDSEIAILEQLQVNISTAFSLFEVRPSR